MGKCKLSKFVYGKYKIRKKNNPSEHSEPIFYTPRQSPLVFKDKVKELLCSLEKRGVIFQVEFNE